jgi:hypothetical protein
MKRPKSEALVPCWYLTREYESSSKTLIIVTLGTGRSTCTLEATYSLIVLVTNRLLTTSSRSTFFYSKIEELDLVRKVRFEIPCIFSCSSKVESSQSNVEGQSVCPSD